MDIANADRKSADLRTFILSIHRLSDNVFEAVKYHIYYVTDSLFFDIK